MIPGRNCCLSPPRSPRSPARPLPVVLSQFSFGKIKPKDNAKQMRKELDWRHIQALRSDCTYSRASASPTTGSLLFHDSFISELGQRLQHLDGDFLRVVIQSCADGAHVRIRPCSSSAWCCWHRSYSLLHGTAPLNHIRSEALLIKYIFFFLHPQ